MIGLGISSGLPINEKNNIICIRDILISFNSLFLIPKLFYEAKIILKLIGSTIRYGLIPEKIDSSNNYRYNSRDISWFYIKAIKDYIYATLDYNFLKEQIYLLNLPENVNISYLRKKVTKNKKVFTVENIIQLIFQYHAQGINFVDKKPEEQPYQKRPRYKKNQNNPDVDAFKINIYLDLETGFIYGGNKLNSGTWMNHIGSSSKAKNLNIPATPRDGADIEIIALLFNCLNFVIELNYKNYYSYKDVILKNNEIFSFYQWSLLIKKILK
jgi:glycogen debranching enzyme